MDAYIGEIRIFAGTFAPVDWAFCEGQILPIQSNTALFSIIGTRFGGDGKTNFALPNLIGRAAVGKGAGPGLTPREVGEIGGSAEIALTIDEMPKHSHVPNFSAAGNETSPAAALWTNPGRRSNQTYSTSGNNTVNMSPLAVGMAGSSVAHNNLQPYLETKFIICLRGEFPNRP